MTTMNSNSTQNSPSSKTGGLFTKLSSGWTSLFARKTVTRDELATAIRKNGLEHVRGMYFDYTGTKACALGQAIYNLYGTTDSLTGKPGKFLSALEEIPDYEVFCGGKSAFCMYNFSILDPKALVIHLNDIHRDSLDEIADKLMAGPNFTARII